jgi:hypothetical protein
MPERIPGLYVSCSAGIAEQKGVHSTNAERINGWKNKPYWIADNPNNLSVLYYVSNPCLSGDWRTGRDAGVQVCECIGALYN